MKKRILSLLLSLIMILSLLPTTAWADRGDSRPLNKLGWNYAVISEKTGGGYTVEQAQGQNDLSSHVTVKVGDITLSKGKANFQVTDSNLDTAVTITADNNYYVAYVVLCCNDSNGYNCQTSRSDNALGFKGRMSGTAVTTTLKALRDKTPHKMGNAYGPGNPYWLMVMVAPVPNPVYVGYDAGTAGSTKINAAPVVKDTASDGGTWDSSLFVKQYPTANGAPNHTVLGISDAAVAEAAATKTTAAPYGYSFDGWKLTYYVNYKNGSFTSETDAGQGGMKAKDDTITLFTHAKLVAQWKANDAPPAPTTGELTITKTVAGVPSSLLSGKTFTFAITKDGTKACDDIVLANGESQTVTLPLGTYTVTETVKADITGYALQKTEYNNAEGISYDVTLKNEDASAADSRTCKPNPTPTPTPSTPKETVAVVNTYTATTTNITVEKKWDNAGGITLPNSIQVQLYNGTTKVGNAVELAPDTNDVWKHTFNSLPTHENGVAITYTVKEVIQNADGTYTPGAPDGFTVTDGDASNYYTITNTADWDTDKVIKPSLTIKKLDGTTPLNGATFKLVASDGRTVTKDTTGVAPDNGIATFANLLPGSYTLTEETPPTGYKKIDTEWTVEVVKNTAYTGIDTPDKNENGKYQKVYDCTVKVYEGTGDNKTLVATPNNCLPVQNDKDFGTNKVKSATLYIYKVDQNDEAIETVTNAVFKLSKEGQAPLTSTYDATKKAYVISDIQVEGDWTLTEETAPTGYDKTFETKTITVKKTTSPAPVLDGGKYYYTDTYTIDDNATVGVENSEITIKNTRSTTQIAPTKVWEDVDGITLPVSITVELYANGTATGECVSLTPPSEGNMWTSATNFSNLPTHDDDGQPITYTVKEVGYTVMVDDKPVYNEKALDGFTATEGDADNGYKITNTAKWSNEVDITGAALTIKKVDSTDDTKLLSGAKFQLSCSDLNYSVEATTDANGIASFTDLQPGTYTLEEVSAPNGYKENNQVWTVEVTQNETHTSVNKLADGTFQKVYDCTVTVSEVKGNEYAPMNPNDGSYTITNELAPTEYKATVEIEKIVKKTGGNVAPGKEEFVFVAYYKGAEKNMPVGEARIITNGVETYTGTPTLTVPASAFKLDANGDGTVTLYVSEVKGSSAGWTYDAKVYELVMTVKNYEFAGIRNGDEIEFVPSIDSVPEGQLPSGDSDTVTLQFTNEFSQTNTPNRPHKPSKPITSVKTGDAGVAMYAMSGLLSLGGAALFMKKRKDEE